MSREIKKCVLEILDALYNRAGFDDWWDRLDEELEDEITQELEEIVKRRLRDRWILNVISDIINTNTIIQASQQSALVQDVIGNGKW